MAKKVKSIVNIQLPAAKATAGPPVGSSLGPHGINIGAFVKEFNEKTANQVGFTIPCVITIYEDRSFTFILKQPPVADLLTRLVNCLCKSCNCAFAFPVSAVNAKFTFNYLAIILLLSLHIFEFLSCAK